MLNHKEPPLDPPEDLRAACFTCAGLGIMDGDTCATCRGLGDLTYPQATKLVREFQAQDILDERRGK